MIAETPKTNIDIPTEIASVTHVAVLGLVGSGI